MMHYLEKIYLLLAEKLQGDFVTIHRRPISASRVGTWSDPAVRTDKVAIVMQGPLLLKNDFTLETIRIYKKNFTDTEIIVSTWEGEDAVCVENLRKEGVTVLLNKTPEYPGISHINYQIVSTRAGIEHTAKNGAEYVLKTRTDQRMYAPNIREFLLNLIETFPVAQGFTQKKRIIVASLNTFKYRLYSPTDMFMFGTAEDMTAYWSVVLDTRKEFSNKRETIREWATLDACETYLATRFLKKIGRKISWTLEDSWRAYSDHFSIVDSENLDLYWRKYDYYKEYRDRAYDGIKNSVFLNFREWFILYANKKDIHAPEDILDTVFGQTISL